MNNELNIVTQKLQLALSDIFHNFVEEMNLKNQ